MTLSEKTAKSVSVTYEMPEKDAIVLYKKADSPKTDVLSRIKSTKVVIEPT